MEKNIAVIGAGYWGKNLVRNFHEIGALRAVCESDPAKGRSVEKDFAGVEVTPDYGAITRDPSVEGVAIALPAVMHYEYAKKALLSGKHVYVEKPLTVRIDESEELVRTAAEAKRTLMVGHLLHYHPVFMKLKEIVKSGGLGRVYYLHSNRLSLGKIRTEENVLWSFAPHDISMVLALAGGEPEDVQAMGGGYVQEKIADVTGIFLRFTGGVRAQITVSWLHPFKEHRLVVVGEKKMAVFNDTLDWPDKLVVYPHRIEVADGVPVPVKADGVRVEVERSEPLKNECLHFIGCMKNGAAPVTDGAEGLRVLKVLHRAQQSLEGR